MRFILVSILFAANIAGAQRTFQREINLPEGVTSKSVDLGPSGDVIVSPSPGLEDSYHVYFLHSSSSFMSGAISWQGREIAALTCYSKKCVKLGPGMYSAVFTVKNVDPKLIREAVAQAYEVPASSNHFDEIVAKRMERISFEMMDMVQISYVKTRNGKPRGEPVFATYTVEWRTSRPELKMAFLTSDPVPPRY